MNENQLPQLPDLREIIHVLTIGYRTTGLSPPEENTLIILESHENNQFLNDEINMSPDI